MATDILHTQHKYAVQRAHKHLAVPHTLHTFTCAAAFTQSRIHPNGIEVYLLYTQGNANLNVLRTHTCTSLVNDHRNCIHNIHIYYDHKHNHDDDDDDNDK